MDGDDMVIATLAFAYSVWAITGSGKDIIAKGFVLLLAGIPVYVFVKWWEGRNATTVEDLFAQMPPAVEAPPEDAYRHGDELLPAGGAR